MFIGKTEPMIKTGWLQLVKNLHKKVLTQFSGPGWTTNANFSNKLKNELYFTNSLANILSETSLTKSMDYDEDTRSPTKKKTM